MNEQRIRQLAAHIRSLPEERYDQHAIIANSFSGGWIEPYELLTNCNTVGCLGGWTCALWAEKIPLNNRLEKAQELLDLDDNQALLLFDIPEANMQPSRELAARVLENLADTGKVEWDRLHAEMEAV